VIDSSWFFDGWEGVVRVLVLGALGYAALVVMLRVSRARTLAQMNVFDFVYVVVMGEILAITVMDDRASLAQGVAALALLIGLQALLSWLTTRSHRIERVVNGEPALVFHHGQFLRDAMGAQRVTEDEVLAAMREEGVADLDEVEAVVLETNGVFSVLHFGRGGAPPHRSTLRDVPGAPEYGDRAEHGGARAGGRSLRPAADAETGAR
jgi:uncharacterized membrane protein YcaP (DUF421 family)